MSDVMIEGSTRPTHPAPADGRRIDRLVSLPQRLPGSPAIWWVVTFILMASVPTVLLWSSGIEAIGTVDPRIWVAALLATYVLAFKGLLDVTARRAMREFEPALPPEVDRIGLERMLVSVPDRIGLAAIVGAEVVISVGYFSDPGEASYIAALPPLGQALILVPNWISIALASVLLVHIIRQLQLVARLHRDARIDAFDPGPSHAFARLTATSAVGVLLFGVAVVADPSAARDSVFFVAEAAGILLLAVAVFGLPLRGMHERLAAEQLSLLRAVNERIKVTTERIHASVDGDRLERSGPLHESLQSLIAERDLVAKLSTWPWSTGTFRGFTSALVLPVVIWAIIRILERFL